jgi:glycosyltransferase involved in cell wall biosynthesis
LIASRRLERHIRLLGFRDDIPDLIQACDLFVFPSIEEGLGSTLIDVMLARRPIVATTAGGIPDVLGALAEQDGPVAWLVDPESHQQLSQAIIGALGPAGRVSDFVSRGQQRALRQFTVEQMVQQTLHHYRQALAECSLPTRKIGTPK